MTDDPELQAAAGELLGDQGEASVDPKQCPTCGQTFDSVRSRAIHERKHRPAGPRRKVSAGTADEVVATAVANVKTIAIYLALVMPHLGVALAGVPEAGVRSRAEIAGDLVRQHARTNPRMLDALRRFNRLFEGSAAVELVAGLGAAVAIDTRLLDPHVKLEIGPFRDEHALQPVQMVLGDVVAYVDSQRPPAPQADGQKPKRERRRAERAADGAEIIEGGVEAT